MKKRIMLLVVGLLLTVSVLVWAEMMKVEQYVIEITPDAEITQELRNVQAIEIFNNGINLRVAFNDVTTATGQAYWVIPDSAVGYERDGLLLQYLTLRLKGDGVGDSATVRVIVYKE